MFSMSKVNRWLALIGLIAFGCAISFAIVRRNEGKVQSASMAQLRSEAEALVDLFYGRLQNAETCTAMLGGQIIQDSAPNSVMMKTGIEDILGDDLRFEFVLDVEAADMRTQVLDAQGEEQTVLRRPAHLSVQFTDDRGRAIGHRRTPADFFVWLTEKQEIVACFGPQSAAALCNESGGYFIPGMNPYHLSCRFSVKTVRLSESGEKPLSQCRVAGIVNAPDECASRYGSAYHSFELSQGRSAFARPKSYYLCQVCQ